MAFAFTVMIDRVYGRGDSNGAPRDLLCDVYMPFGLPHAASCVIVVPGGGFTGCSRDNADAVGIAMEFAGAGYVAVVIEHRVQGDDPNADPSYTFAVAGDFGPDPTETEVRHAATVDVRRAVRWARANAAGYGIDAEKIFLIGASSAGATCVQAGTAPASLFAKDLPADIEPAENNTSESVDVVAWSDLWGRSNNEYCYPRSAPGFIAHGDADGTVDISYSQDLDAALGAAYVDHDFHVLAGRGHSAFDATIDGKSLSVASMEFFARYAANANEGGDQMAVVPWEASEGGVAYVPVTLPDGGGGVSDTAIIDLGAGRLVGVWIPSDLTQASISLRCSYDGVSDHGWVAMGDNNDSVALLKPSGSPGGLQLIGHLYSHRPLPLRWIILRSGATGETADRTLYLVIAPPER